MVEMAMRMGNWMVMAIGISDLDNR